MLAHKALDLTLKEIEEQFQRLYGNYIELHIVIVTSVIVIKYCIRIRELNRMLALTQNI